MPIYLTGFIDENTDRLKHYHDDFLPLGTIVQPKTFREGYLGRAGLYKWVAIDNGRFTEAGRRLFCPDEYTRMIRHGLDLAGDNLLSPPPPMVPSTGRLPSSSPDPGSPGSGVSEPPPPSSPKRG